MERTALASTSTNPLRDIYARMLLTRRVDERAWDLHRQGHIHFVASCRGHEAAQVGSAFCIEVGKDFTLPYYRDLGVVLTIGMTPYEVFRTYLQQSQPHSHRSLAESADPPADTEGQLQQPSHHWGYYKHNMITGPAPVATQILHAAGIAFACKLRKTSAVTVAYCGEGATAEPDFLEGLTFAALHQLPAIFICEQDCLASQTSALQSLALPPGLVYRSIDAADVLSVYTTVQEVIQHVRAGSGPVLLEMCVTRAAPGQSPEMDDPLYRCQQLLESQELWDEEWAEQLQVRVQREVEQALEDALRDVG